MKIKLKNSACMDSRRIDAPLYQAFSRRMVLILIFVSFTPMLLASGIILDEFRISYREKIYAHLAELVLKHKQDIDTFLLEKMGNIRFVAASFTPEELTEKAFLEKVLEDLRREEATAFEDLGIVNEAGRQISYAGPYQLEQADYSAAEWFQEAIKTPNYISEVFLGLRGKPHFIVSVRGRHDGRYWILRSTIDFLYFNSLVENLRIGRTGFAFILNREGEFQTQPFFQSASGEAQELYRLIRRGERRPNGVYILERTLDTGEKNIYVGAFLKNEDWLLIYQQDAADAFSDLKRAQGIAVLIIFMGGLAIICTALILSKNMVRQVAEIDQEKELMNEQIIETGKLASVGELAAGVAHEINNPVAIMVEEAGWIEDLLEEEDLKESENLSEFRRALNQIHIQGKRCKEITHKLLSFARKTDSRIHEIEVNELVEEVVGLSAQQARYNNVEIKMQLEDPLPPMRMSPTEFQQVLLNLINNALYAMDGKGGVIDISTRRKNHSILIEVSDTGPGIPEANLARIFDPFFTTKPVGKGSGLGLSICYGIIKKMDGDIEVRSVVGEGTTFTVRIPVQTETASQPESHSELETEFPTTG